MSENKKVVYRWFRYFSGFLFLALGILGIFLPLLPTTPFLLLAATIFMHSNRKIYVWMFRNRFFGKQFLSYVKNKSVSLYVKISSLITLFLTMGYSIFFVVENIYLQVFLALITFAVTLHILKLKTIDKEISNL